MLRYVRKDGCDGGSCSDNGSRACDCGPFKSFICKQQHKWWGFPEEFHELPLGCASSAILQSQVTRREEARLTLYDYDFIYGTTVLNSRGRSRLTQLGTLALQMGGTITIQPVQPDLDSRRLAGVQTLAADLLGLHPNQIVLAPPIAAGVDGEEAVVIRHNHLQHTSQYGVRRFSFGSFSPGTGGSAGSTR